MKSEHGDTAAEEKKNVSDYIFDHSFEADFYLSGVSMTMDIAK